jgi:hypothetical protein
MKLGTFFCVLAALALCANFAMADPDHVEKPWTYGDWWYEGKDEIPEQEPNDDCPGQAFGCDDIIIPAYLDPDNLDWYHFTLDAEYYIYLGTDVVNAGDYCDTYLELYTGDCLTLLAEDDDGGPSTYSLIEGNFAAGDYAVKVRGYSAYSYGPYRLFLICEEPPPPPVYDCPTEGYDYCAMTVDLVLETSVMYTFGPLPCGDAGPIEDVVLEIDISQTYCGDLIISLYYDEDGDTIYDAGPVHALCRPNLTGCPWPDDCCGCYGDVIGIYMFGDAATELLGEGENCITTIPQHCYAPAIESPAGFVDTFGGMECGGDWYLEIGDGAAGDDTHLIGWGVYVACGEEPPPPTATESTTWGQIKSIYDN